MQILNKLTTRWIVVAVVIVTLGASAFGIAVALGVPDQAGVIHACYSNNNGDVRLVESAAQCKNNETHVTWNQAGVPGPAGPTGPIGPAGPTGPQGPAGPAGQVRAVGSVFPGTPLGFYPQGLRGWVAVERSSVGTYCLTPDPSITSNDAVLMLSLGSPGATFQGVVTWTGYCSTSPLKFQVQTTQNGLLMDNIYFTAMVP